MWHHCSESLELIRTSYNYNYKKDKALQKKKIDAWNMLQRFDTPLSVIPVFFSAGAKDACLRALQEADTREGADSG